jgi:hypothetical protein
MHGGATPAGWASKGFAHGQRVRRQNLPNHLAGTYHEARKDADLLSLRDEIATTDARIDELWGKVDQDLPHNLWEGLLASFRECEKYKDQAASTGSVDASGKPDPLQEQARRDFWSAWENLGLLIANGSDDLQKKREIRAEEEHRRKLADSERARLKDLNQYVTAEKAATMVQVLIGCLRRHVTDRAILGRIQRDFSRFFDSADSTGTGPGDDLAE